MSCAMKSRLLKQSAGRKNPFSQLTLALKSRRGNRWKLKLPVAKANPRHNRWKLPSNGTLIQG